MRENERALLPLDKVHHQQRDPRLLRKTVSSLSNRHVRLVERYASCIALSVVESVTYFDSKEGYDQLTHSANVVFICVYVRILACTDEDRTTLKEANTFSPNSVMLPPLRRVRCNGHVFAGIPAHSAAVCGAHRR